MKTATVLITISLLFMFAKCEEEKEHHMRIACYRQGFPSSTKGGYNTNCTHVMFKVGRVDPWRGHITENSLGRIKRLKTRNGGSKLILHLDPLNDFTMNRPHRVPATLPPQVIDSKAGRLRLVKSAVSTLKNLSYDGLDVEFDSKYFHQRALFVADLRKEFDQHGLILSGLFPKNFMDEDISITDIEEVTKYLDFISIVCFEKSKQNNYTELSAPLYSVDGRSVNDTINMFVNMGIPKNKILMGIQTHGIVHILEDADEDHIGSPSNQAGWNNNGYVELSKIRKFDWIVHRDDLSKAPYAVNYLQWASYEDETSIYAKVEYIKENGLGGAMLSSNYHQDDLSHNLPFVNTLNRMFSH